MFARLILQTNNAQNFSASMVVTRVIAEIVGVRILAVCSPAINVGPYGVQRILTRHGAILFLTCAKRISLARLMGHTQQGVFAKAGGSDTMTYISASTRESISSWAKHLVISVTVL